MAHYNEKLLLFGGKPETYLTEWEITSDLALAENKLDVSFEAISNDELISRYKSLCESDTIEASRLAKDLLDGASGRRKSGMPSVPPLDEVEKATKLYIAMKRIQEERAGDALTVVCGPWIMGESLPTPCVPLMLFQEEGIPAACQGDIDALLTMVLFKRAAGLTSFMGGAIKARGHLGINHCVLSRNMINSTFDQTLLKFEMFGADAELQPYLVSDYHGRKNSPTVWTEIPAGETVTVARLTQNLENLLLATGTVIACPNDNWRCRNTLVIQGPDRNKVFKAVKGHQNHYVVACGDHTRALTQLAESKRIDVVNL